MNICALSVDVKIKSFTLWTKDSIALLASCCSCLKFMFNLFYTLKVDRAEFFCFFFATLPSFQCHYYSKNQVDASVFCFSSATELIIFWLSAVVSQLNIRS